MTMNEKVKNIQIRYYAILREASGVEKETVKTAAHDAGGLYKELQARYNIRLPDRNLKVAVNDHFCSLNTVLKDGDSVVFMPPVAGG